MSPRLRRALIARHPGDEFQFTAQSAAIENLICAGGCDQRFILVRRRTLVQKIGAKLVSLLGIIACQKWRIGRRVRGFSGLGIHNLRLDRLGIKGLGIGSFSDTRSQECYGKTGKNGAAIGAERVFF